MIIPTSAESYVARAVDENNKLPKMKAGAEFDALSIIEVGNDAIALGSTTNVDKLLN